MEIYSAFLELLRDGGPITWIICLFSVITAIIIVERLFHLHRAQINVPDFMRGVTTGLSRENANTMEAISICGENPGPVAHILRAAILNSRRGEKKMCEAVEDAGLEEVPRLERSIDALASIATLTILLGLLGTMLGLIDLFKAIEGQGTWVEVGQMAKSIKTALISSAAGLTVAIPAIGFHNYFTNRVKSIILDMEKAAAEMIHFLVDREIAVAGKVPTEPEEIEFSEPLPPTANVETLPGPDEIAEAGAEPSVARESEETIERAAKETV